MKVLSYVLLFLLLQACSHVPHREQPDKEEWISFSSEGELVFDEVKFQRDLNASLDLVETPVAFLSASIENNQDSRFKADQGYDDAINIAYGKRYSSNFSDQLASYLLNQSFVCRYPIETYYFDHRYQRNTSNSHCPSTLPLRVVDKHKGIQLKKIQPERISEVHLLFAGKGKEWVSKFGHVLLRLVVCPRLNASKQECEQNLGEHIVLGFLANIDELDMSYWKGITGGYETYLLAEPFMSVYSRYAVDEFRELYSLPLILNENEKRNLFKKLVQAHWSFADDYKFFSQNCATFMQQLLLSSLSKYQENDLLNSSVIRPDRNGTYLSVIN